MGSGTGKKLFITTKIRMHSNIHQLEVASVMISSLWRAYLWADPFITMASWGVTNALDPEAESV